MEAREVRTLIEAMFVEMEAMIPEYMQNPDDKRIANGNVAACIMEDNGTVHGRLFGTYKIRSREAYKVAWTKASQVWITGMKTGEYEKHFFNKTVEDVGIEAPDLIGWEGGQPLTLKDGTRLSVGFSGFRGVVDLEIAVRALEKVEAGK